MFMNGLPVEPRGLNNSSDVHEWASGGWLGMLKALCLWLATALRAWVPREPVLVRF